ncbi:restriction endonuclease [Agrobacterium sp. MA01]|uniref:restriction endonuclease subunit S n=1 Tax=Agrobacterium sp. MA01 TaxID=2664893 RepID=UPI00129A9DB7|nr:restriction endonuclease subunit S [Agrobacterium sp. MA01]QGG89030.1 restriction endonuclease [Agrobacterium sp. MA01]
MMNLPNSWTQVALEELFQIVLGGDWGSDPSDALDDSSLVRCIRASELRDWGTRKGKTAAIRRLKNSSIEKRRLRTGDILVEVSGGGPDQAVGRTVLITNEVLSADQNCDFVCTNFFRFCRPKININTAYINWYLQHFYSVGGTKALQAGSNNLRNLRFPDYLAQAIPISPLNEQRRIVAKIEELFSELDNGVESLITAHAQLKVYRQSVLKAAFEGKLTKDWRIENSCKLDTGTALLEHIKLERERQYKDDLSVWKKAVCEAETANLPRPRKPSKPTAADKPSPKQASLMVDLPPSWEWVQLGDFAFVTKLAGFEYTKFVRYDDNGDLEVIKAENAGPNGFRETDFSRIRSETVAALERSQLHGGELLMVFVGAGTGNVAMVPEGRTFFLGPNIGMMRVTSDRINPQYVEYFLRSPQGRELALSSVKAVAQPSLSMGTIRQIPVALPSLYEQTQIVRILESRLETADLMEAEIDAALARAEAMRQSILKRAFSGQLVAQDPADEPAFELLARISANYEQSDKKASRRNKKNGKKEAA